ncbi:MAG TPA: L-aspartate oxidase [Spirochaetia bacterium]|nr:MAG: L-aspartate oxidase [Spirochaetes bacterium GWB1_36_13]HCL55611.1 L-aspartate oxidase [Spirochaetia bacterium]
MAETIHTEILIIGSGIAGGTAALYASKLFERVTLVTKEKNIENCNSYYAQGGIIYRGNPDSPELLVQDILYAGGKINKKSAAEVLAKEGPDLVEEILIKELEIDFSKNEKGELDLTEEGGHQSRRIIHSEDQTGKKIEIALTQALYRQKNIEIISDFMAIDLISSSHHSPNPLDVYEEPEILGVYGLKDGKIIKILSRATILATGGIGNIYLHSTNPDMASGDGIAMADRAGARIINMEYTQFHPTTLFHKDSKRFLISESVRGEGAVLRNKKQEAFMEKYHPMKDLAPRDIVTRAILSEMTERKENYVYLDLSKVGTKEKIKNRFPHIYHSCMEYDIDITEEMIPVVPAYHFSCGGIFTDIFGKTTLKRLFAVGETACTGLHGGNRLASTSLLEGLVYGQRAVDCIYKNWKKYKKIKKYEIPQWKVTGDEKEDKALIFQDWGTVKSIMWNYVGPIRNSKRLARALKDLNQLADTVEDFYLYCYPERNIIELRNGIRTAKVVALSAWKNKKSIGAHFRED